MLIGGFGLAGDVFGAEGLGAEVKIAVLELVDCFLEVDVVLEAWARLVVRGLDKMLLVGGFVLRLDVDKM